MNLIEKGLVIKTEWNRFETGGENKSAEPCLARDGLDSIERKMVFLAKEYETSSSISFFIKLIQQIKSNLTSINNYTQISRGKFGDKEFGEYYCRVVTEDIEKMEIVLNSLVDYAKLQAPIRKTNTVHKIIEEILKKHQIKLEERGINLLKRFEKDLPETIVSDDQLRYVLSAILQYAMAVTPSNRNVGVSTKSFLSEKGAGETGGLFKKSGEYIEIAVIFWVQQRRGPTASKATTIHEEETPAILLRFVKKVVVSNHGTMKMGTDQKRTRRVISLRFPVERRKVVCS